MELSSICFRLLHYMKEKQLVPSSFSLFFYLSFPCGTGQSWEINRNKLSALQASPPLLTEVEAGGEARERQSGGEMEPGRWSSANKNSSDSWKQLIWLTISTNFKSAIEIFFYAKHVVTIRDVQYISMYIDHQTHKNTAKMDIWQRTNIMTVSMEKQDKKL